MIDVNNVKPQMNDGGASELCIFDISVIHKLILFLRIIRQEE